MLFRFCYFHSFLEQVNFRSYWKDLEHVSFQKFRPRLGGRNVDVGGSSTQPKSAVIKSLLGSGSRIFFPARRIVGVCCRKPQVQSRLVYRRAGCHYRQESESSLTQKQLSGLRELVAS